MFPLTCRFYRLNDPIGEDGSATAAAHGSGGRRPLRYGAPRPSHDAGQHPRPGGGRPQVSPATDRQQTHYAGGH